jgi:photosystem II stability/assembly factor-like uncharacterized protein
LRREIGWTLLAVSMGWASRPLQAQTPALRPLMQPPVPAAYRWKNIVIRGGGFVTGILFHPAVKGLVYARTDVGGAYRSDDSGANWVPLTDQFGREDSTYLGIESVAVDAEDPDKLYLAAGMYSADWGGQAAILRSSDRGKTFARTPMPFKMGGNDNGRGCGERLAVDPHMGRVIFFGSRKAGLWRTSDSGVTWAHVDSFPVPSKLTGPGEATGITFVQFDDAVGAPGTPTPTIYVGVAQPDQSLYRSDDAGKSWSPVPGVPHGLFPNHAVLDHRGSLYLSFVDNVGPNGILDGAIWKYTPAKERWTDITPAKPGVSGERKFGYGGISVDTAHPDTLMVTTIDRWAPDIIFRSTDGGRRWKDVATSAIYAAPTVPWVYWHREHPGGKGWMNDIKIDPFDSSVVLYTTGEGIWGSRDVTAMDAGKPTHWGFPDDGFEETVPLAIVSPPQGVHLLSGIADVGGFRHEDLRQSPSQGFFVDPMLITTTSLDFAALAPSSVARVGRTDQKVVHGGYSLDGGETWKPFASEVPGSQSSGGHIAVSANGSTAIWTPDRGASFWTADWGKNWTECHGLSANALVASDRANPAKFYALNSETGQILESTDSARTFVPLHLQLNPKIKHAVLAPTPGIDGDLWVSDGDRVFHTVDSGQTFVTLEGMTQVYTVGFGAPAPGSRTPTIFMNGVATQHEGLYRSDDGGNSWLRIDDPAHQFGWKNAITGDPRVYGRVYLATGGRGIIYGDPAP